MNIPFEGVIYHAYASTPLSISFYAPCLKCLASLIPTIWLDQRYETHFKWITWPWPRHFRDGLLPVGLDLLWPTYLPSLISIPTDIARRAVPLRYSDSWTFCLKRCQGSMQIFKIQGEALSKNCNEMIFRHAFYESINPIKPIAKLQKRQSARADFASSAPWRVTVNNTSMTCLRLPHYLKTWRNPQNRKEITYCIVVVGGPSHSHR